MDESRKAKRPRNLYARHRDHLIVLTQAAQHRLQDTQDRIERTRVLLAEARQLLAETRSTPSNHQPPEGNR